MNKNLQGCLLTIAFSLLMLIITIMATAATGPIGLVICALVYFVIVPRFF